MLGIKGNQEMFPSSVVNFTVIKLTNILEWSRTDKKALESLLSILRLIHRKKFFSALKSIFEGLFL